MPTELAERAAPPTDTDLAGDPGATPAPSRPVLVEARLAAERERERQQRRDGRTGALALLAGIPAGFRRLGSAEAAESGLRYQPVVWSLIAVAAVALFLPGRPSSMGIPGPVAAPVAQTATPPPSSPPSSPPATAAPSPPGAGVAVPPPAPVRPGPAPVGGPAPAAPAPTAPTPAAVPPAPNDDAPLSVRGHGWAATAPVLAAATVPEGTLPVANRLGSTDMVSFVRLDGSATVLRLVEDADGAIEALGDAAVSLCPVEAAGWEETPGQSLSDAPAWGTGCVDGIEDDGTWSFDLSGLGDPTADTGFALVPGPEAPPEFQISFTP